MGLAGQCPYAAFPPVRHMRQSVASKTPAAWGALRTPSLVGRAQATNKYILDGPARSSAATLELGKSADVVIQPTGAGRDDLRPAVRLFYELEKAQVPKDRLFFALSRVGTPSEEEVPALLL